MSGASIRHRDELQSMIKRAEERIAMLQDGRLASFEKTIENAQWTNVTDRDIAREREQIETLEVLIKEITESYGN